MREFLYSRNAVFEALRAQRRRVFRLLVAEGVHERGRLLDLLRLAVQRGIEVQRLPRSRLDGIHEHHQGVVAEVEPYPYVTLADILEHARRAGEPPFILLLDALHDPQNFGTLLRTAEAVGVHGVVIPLARTVTVTPAVVNVSSGASEHLLIAQANLAQTLESLREAEVWVVGLDPRGVPLDESHRHFLRGALGVVIGSEGSGLRELTRRKCDVLLTLPMRGRVESLNAAVAGSVALYLAYLARMTQFHTE